MQHCDIAPTHPAQLWATYAPSHMVPAQTCMLEHGVLQAPQWSWVLSKLS
jgi:hypothetical protein